MPISLAELVVPTWQQSVPGQACAAFDASVILPPVTVTDRLVLRRPTKDDVDDVHRLHADPRVWEHSPEHVHRQLAETEAMLGDWITHWERHGFGYWLVLREEKLIGVGGAMLLEGWLAGENVLNVYYRFAPEAWGHGFASELVAATIHLSPALPLVARVVPGNEPSVRVALRQGFERRPELDRDGLETYFRLPETKRRSDLSGS